MTRTEEALIEGWRTEIFKKADDVDPNDEHDWFDLCYGFFLGRGLPPAKANSLAVETQRRGLL